MKTLITSIVLAAATATSAMAWDSNSTFEELHAEANAGATVLALKTEWNWGPRTASNPAWVAYDTAKVAFKADFYGVGPREKLTINGVSGQTIGRAVVSVNEEIANRLVAHPTLNSPIAGFSAQAIFDYVVGFIGGEMAFVSDVSDVEEALGNGALTVADVVAHLNDLYN